MNATEIVIFTILGTIVTGLTLIILRYSYLYCREIARINDIRNDRERQQMRVFNSIQNEETGQASSVSSGESTHEEALNAMHTTWSAPIPDTLAPQSSRNSSLNSSTTYSLDEPPSYDSVMRQREIQIVPAETRRAYVFAEGSDCDDGNASTAQEQ